MERKPVGTKKEIQEYYNYKIKGYLARDYRNPKIGTGLQKK